MEGGEVKAGEEESELGKRRTRRYWKRIRW